MQTLVMNQQDYALRCAYLDAMKKYDKDFAELVDPIGLICIGWKEE
jgi:hypothetical protein